MVLNCKQNLPTVELQEWTAWIEATLQSLIPCNLAPYSQAQEAARYALLSNGKRLRPLLALTVAQALGGLPATALHPACAIEFIHTYSMIHDDLPCMDDDDYRRGQFTVHKQYSEEIAVLAGDYLLTHAFEVLAEAPDLSAEQRISMIRILSQKAGGAGMIGGQVMDITPLTNADPLQWLESTHLRKTGALIAAPLVCGAIAAQASPDVVTTLDTLGYKLGLAFQIIDDVLDVTAGHVKHGNDQGSDATKGKVTYASLLGVDAAQQKAVDLYNTIDDTLAQLPGDTDLLRHIAKKFVFRAN